MSFFLGAAQPCVDEEYVESPANGVYYPLEKARIRSTCPIDDNINKAYDTRYKAIGLNISEYDMQMGSGVLAKLHDLPLYNKYVRFEYQSKSSVSFDFMMRSLIPWKLSCEHDGKTRAEVLSRLSVAGPKDNSSIEIILMEAIGFLVAPFITFCIYLCVKSSNAAATTFVFLFTIQVMVLLFMSVYVLQSAEQSA